MESSCTSSKELHPRFLLAANISRSESCLDTSRRNTSEIWRFDIRYIGTLSSKMIAVLSYPRIIQAFTLFIVRSSPEINFGRQP